MALNSFPNSFLFRQSFDLLTRVSFYLRILFLKTIPSFNVFHPRSFPAAKHAFTSSTIAIYSPSFITPVQSRVILLSLRNHHHPDSNRASRLFQVSVSFLLIHSSPSSVHSLQAVCIMLSPYRFDPHVCRDLPPAGGFAEIKYKRNLPFKGPGALTILLGVAAMSAYGFYKVGQSNLEKR